jgi:uncharacterized membrane protein YdjX (TVP38/TMEM64 family)
MRHYDEAILRPALTGVIAAFAVFGYLYSYGFSIERIKPETVSGLIASLGAWGPLVYIVSNVVRPLIFFPAAILAVAGGMAFGPLWGTVYLIAGTMGGATLCFWLARWMGGDRLKRYLPRWVASGWIGSDAAEMKFRTLLLLRLAPILPWDGVSFASGLANVRFWPYFWATFAGSIPGAVVFCQLGDYVNRSWPTVPVLAGGIALALICLAVWRWAPNCRW